MSLSLASAPPPCTHGRCGGCARCQTQTFANTGDCAARVNRNPGVDQHVGTSTLLIFIIRPTEQTHNPRTNHAQFERKHTRNARDTRHTHTSLRTTRSPSVARRHVVRALRCRLRHTKRRRDLLAAEASRRHALQGETFLCGSHHVVVRRLENTWDLEGNVACGVSCALVSNVEKPELFL